MLQNRTFYYRWWDEPGIYTSVQFLPAPESDPTIDGMVRYKMLTKTDRGTGSVEEVYYRMIRGKLYIFGNDGSMTRYTLVRREADRWILWEEEAQDGFEKRSDFGRKEKVFWYFHRPPSFPDLDHCRIDPRDPMTCTVK
jgi:hypothetical protein